MRNKRDSPFCPQMSCDKSITIKQCPNKCKGEYKCAYYDYVASLRITCPLVILNYATVTYYWKKLGQATTSATTTKITKSTPYDIHITTSRTTTNANSATIIDKAKTHEDSPTTILRTTTSRVNAGHIINTYDLRFTFEYLITRNGA